MMNRKRWKHLIAAVMCATLVLSTPAAYAAEEQPSVQTEVKEEKAQDTEQKKEEVKEDTSINEDGTDTAQAGNAAGGLTEVEEPQNATSTEEAQKTDKVKTESSVEESTKLQEHESTKQGTLPSVTTREVTFEGKDVELAVSLGEYADNIGAEVKINGMPMFRASMSNNTIKIPANNIDKISAGVYPIEVTFKDAGYETLNVDKSCSITVTEAERASTVYKQVSFDGTEDIVLNFNKGSNYYELKSISQIKVSAISRVPLEGCDYEFETTNVGTDFTYDLEKSEIVLNKDYLKSHKLDPYVVYSIEPIYTAANGVSIGMGNDFGIGRNWQFSFYDKQNGTYPGALYNRIVYSGNGDVVLNFAKGTGIYEVQDIRNILFCIDGQIDSEADGLGKDFTYDVENGTLTIKESFFKEMNHWEKNKAYSLTTTCIVKNGNGVYTLGTTENSNWQIVFPPAKDSNTPELVDTSRDFNGTKDLTFSFKNTKDINEIKSIDFYLRNDVLPDPYADCLVHFNIDNYETSFNYDIEKGQIVLYKHAVSSLVYGKYPSVGNTYKGEINYIAKDGTEKTAYGEWNIKVLERAEEAPPQHVVDLPKENPVITKSDMEDLISKNQTDDIVINIPNGNNSTIVFSFAKGTMKLIDGKSDYDFGAEMVTDYAKLGKMPFTKDEFAFRINYNYSGELPATANISIPVDAKWVGKTLYYYEVKDNGDYDFLTSGTVSADGTLTVAQNHCSDYVAITRKPDAQGNISTTPTDPTKPSDITNTTTPTSVINGKTSPKTGDTSAIWLYLALMMGAGVSVIVAKRKSKIK